MHYNTKWKVILLKQLLLMIITKIKLYIKTFIMKWIETIKFQGHKNGVIKEMYKCIFEKKRKEKEILLCQLNNIRQNNLEIKMKINTAKQEEILYKNKIRALKTFQNLLISKHI